MNMLMFPAHRTQQGVALVFALLILLVLTILGVASMGNIAMQERMSGNANLQALAFQAASSAVPGALQFGTNSANWGGNTRCAQNDQWSGPWLGAGANEWSEVIATSGVRAEFRRQVRCIKDEELVALGVIDPQSQLYVRTQGRVRRSDGQRALATREIEVRIERRGGISESAIRVEGEAMITSATPNSNNFLVYGGTGGTSISATTIGNRDIIRDSVHKNRVNQYQPNPPGIVQSDYRSPWNNPEELAALMNELRENLKSCQPDPEAPGFCRPIDHVCDPNGDPDPLCPAPPPSLFDYKRCLYYPGNEIISGDGNGLGDDPAPTERDDFKLHFVDGDLDLRGGTDNYGLIISKGTFRMSGNANLTGKAIALGGGFELYGGGDEETNGGIFLVNLDLDVSPPAFGSSDLDLSGGGNHQVYYKCETVNKALALFERCGVSVPPGPNVCTDESAGGGTRNVIASWRENFGWRENLDLN